MKHKIDVREYAEFAAVSIAGARLTPLAELASQAAKWNRSDEYLLICKSGKRAARAEKVLVGMGFEHLEVLDGGMDAWVAEGKPTAISAKRPISLERQVRIIAGSFVMISTVIGLTWSPIAFGFTLFVGCGLVFAGATDICMMATLLGKLPWNRA